MPGSLPPPPIGEPPGSFAWQQWYLQLGNLYSVAGAIPWDSIDTTDSNLTDLATRTHNSLQTIQGGTSGEYYHATSSEYTGTGTGVLVRKTSPTLETPVLGAATGTTLSLTSYIRPGTDGGSAQTAAGLFAGSGAPNNANGQNGDFYFRSDGTAAGNNVIYHKEAGAWIALVTT